MYETTVLIGKFFFSIHQWLRCPLLVQVTLVEVAASQTTLRFMLFEPPSLYGTGLGEVKVEPRWGNHIWMM